jgi:hypothetical protein
LQQAKELKPDGGEFWQYSIEFLLPCSGKWVCGQVECIVFGDLCQGACNAGAINLLTADVFLSKAGLAL